MSFYDRMTKRSDVNQDSNYTRGHSRIKLLWIPFSFASMVCFAFSSYFLGIVSEKGYLTKFLCSLSFLFVTLALITAKNINHCL